MPQQVKTRLELENGKTIAHFKSMVVMQDLFRHHRFEITVPFNELEKNNEIFFKDSHKNVCGKTISISFESVPEKKTFDFRFKGIITEIILSNLADYSNAFVIKGYSPTMLLEDCSLRRSITRKNVQQVFETVLNEYPGNIIKKKLNPRHKNIVPYVVQYDETNFTFLSRLAAEYGEWMYYSGQEIILGNTSNSKEVDFLIDGIQSFDMSISLMPAKFNISGYDYTKDQFYKGKSSAQPVEGLGQFSKFALEESENLFTQDSLLMAGTPVYNQQELDELIKFRRSGIASNMIVFHGRGENPDLMVGSVINVSTTRPEKGGRSNKESVGKYRISEITHSIDNNGNYSNSFKAIPETAKFPPVNPYIIHPVGQPELATVTDNNDPEKLSRVKVEFHWPGNERSSEWIRVGTFYAGGDDRKGMQFIPEKDAQVVVGYEMNKPESPFILTSLYPKKDGMRSRKGNNDEKTFYTKAGNLIELTDKQGENKIQITNVNKSDTAIVISFKDNGEITLKSNGKVNIEAQENISVSAAQKLTLEAQDIELKAGNKFSISAASVNLEAGTTAEIKAKASVKINSASTELTGDGMTTIKGGLVKIN